MKRKMLSVLLCMLLLVSCLCPVTVLAEATEHDPANAPLLNGTDLEKGGIYTELGSIFAGITVYQLNNSIPLTLTGYETESTQDGYGSVENDMVLRLTGEFQRDPNDGPDNFSNTSVYWDYSLTSSLLPAQHDGGWMYEYIWHGGPDVYLYSVSNPYQMYRNPDLDGYTADYNYAENYRRSVQCEGWSEFDPTDNIAVVYSNMPEKSDYSDGGDFVTIPYDTQCVRVVMSAHTFAGYTSEQDNSITNHTYKDKITIEITLTATDAVSAVTEDTNENPTEDADNVPEHGDWTYDTDADEKSGAETELLISAAAVVILGGGAIAVGKKGKKKKNKNGNKQKAEEPQQKQSDKDENESESEKVQYAMRIYKDFGDTLTAGGESLPIYARIVKIDTQGGETTDASLTSMIRISSPEYLQITAHKTEGEYKSALVCAPEADSIPDSAVVEFTLQANGGRFTNRVHFKIKAESMLIFAEEEGLDVNGKGDTCRMDMLGDGSAYLLHFTVKDAPVEPNVTDMYGEINNGFTVSFEKADKPFTYTACLRCNMPKKTDGVFFTRDEIITHIFVKCAGVKEPLCGSIYVTLIPEGLSVLCRETKDGFMVVDTNKDESAAGLDSVIRPVSFETVLAYTADEANGKRAVIADAGSYTVKFGKPEGSKAYIDVFREALRYEINTKWAEDQEFSFVPKAVLPQPNEPYEIEIPITATHKGRSFSVKLPIRLYGEQPKKPTDWDKEYEFLKRALVRYGLSDNEHLREQLRKAKSLTANELLMLRRAIIEEAMVYYTQDAGEFVSLDQSLGRYEFTFSCVKWIMDQSFSVIATRLYGSTAEAFLSPFKDMVGQFLGDLTASAYWGGEIEASWSSIGQTALKGCESTLGNKMGDAVTEGSVQKLGGVIAVFLMITFLEKFYHDDEAKGDIYKSISAACNDLAGNAIKTAFSAKFGNALKDNPKLRAAVQNYFSKDFCKRFPNPNVSIGHAVNYATDSAMGLINDAIEKYATETLGLAAVNVISNVENLQDKPTAKDMFDIDIAIGDSTLRFHLLDNAQAVASFIWDNTFGRLIPGNAKEEPVTDCTKYYRIL